jgi:hypothetical protein
VILTGSGGTAHEPTFWPTDGRAPPGRDPPTTPRVDGVELVQECYGGDIERRGQTNSSHRPPRKGPRRAEPEAVGRRRKGTYRCARRGEPKATGGGPIAAERWAAQTPAGRNRGRRPPSGRETLAGEAVPLMRTAAVGTGRAPSGRAHGEGPTKRRARGCRVEAGQ